MKNVGMYLTVVDMQVEYELRLILTRHDDNFFYLIYEEHM